MARRKGFTLVELLVVIGIIALLIAILLPSLNKARRHAEAIACASNMQQLHTGFVLFSLDYRGWYPRAFFNHESPRYGGEKWPYREVMSGWDYVLHSKYVKSREVFQCPSDSREWLRGEWNNSYTDLPDKPTADDLPSSYRMNTSNQPWAMDAVRQNHFREPGRVIFLVEGTPGPPDNWVYHHVATHEQRISGRVTKSFKNNVAFDRHDRRQGRANYLFADGHVESLTWEDTWKPIGPPPRVGQAMIPSADRGITMWRQRYERPSAVPAMTIQLDYR